MVKMHFFPPKQPTPSLLIPMIKSMPSLVTRAMREERIMKDSVLPRSMHQNQVTAWPPLGPQVPLLARS